MKKSFLTFMLAGTILTGGLVSCSSDDDNSSVNTQDVEGINNIAQSGTWRITSYVDSGNTVTHIFEGYNFTFGPNNALTAVKAEVTRTGSWYVSDDDSNDDDNSNGDSASDVDFNIVFDNSVSDGFYNMTDDWDVSEITATKISLIDVSGGNGGTDTLVFEKN